MHSNRRLHITKYIAVVSTLLILAFLLINFLDYSDSMLYLLGPLAGGAIIFLLIRVYILLSKVKDLWHSREAHLIRGHILLHFIPLSYLILHLFIQITFLINLLYALPVILFFFTGRLTWKALFEQFGSKMYHFFYKSNTALLIGPTVLLILGLLYKETFVTNFYHRILLVYFIIHILLIGIAIVKIEADILALNEEENSQSKD